MPKEIPLSKGAVAIVDDADYEWLSQWQWHLSTTGYAIRSTGHGEKRQRFRMHRVILGINGDKSVAQCDHINRDRLDNRRANLRPCSQTQNQGNRAKRPDNSSGYKGVGWQKNRGYWEAFITVKGRKVHLGVFQDKHEAARAYNAAAVSHFGDFARLNVVTER